LDHQNNFVGILKIMSNAAKNFDILETSLSFYIIILTVQQNYFSDLYPTNILNLLAKPFFPCNFRRWADIFRLLYFWTFLFQNV